MEPEPEQKLPYSFSANSALRDSGSTTLLSWLFKGTVPRDFLPLVFFFKQLLLAPVDKPSNDFDFFRIFAEIFDYFGTSPVSTTPAMHALPVSLTPVNNFFPVSLVSDTFTVLESFTGVNEKFLTGVIDTGKACIRQCQ